LQGGNVGGGLGLDREFFESILVPQVMIYGFLGLRPAAEGFSIDPKLPKDWAELTITRIHLHDKVIAVKVQTAERMVSVIGAGVSAEPLVVTLPGEWRLSCSHDLAIPGAHRVPAR